MYPTDYNYKHPAVPPLYPMDPCRPMPYEPTPMPYEPEPMPYMPAPIEHYMPMPHMGCPMMDPRFRECVQVCMMQCGNYPVMPEYPMDMNYAPIHSIDMNELNPYYPEETE